MRVYGEAENSKEILNDLPPDVRAVMELCFDDSYILFASHSFIDIEQNGRGVFRTSIGTGYKSALRQLIIWVRAGMPEGYEHDEDGN